MLGRPRQLPYEPMPSTMPRTSRPVSGWSASPKRSGSITAIGRAPMVRMSRTMPPTPVAAPWCGSTKDGWLCDSILKVTARPLPTSTTPAFSPMPISSTSLALCGHLLAELLEVHLARLVRAVLRPHHGVHRQLAAGRPAAEDLADLGVLVVLEPQGRVRLLSHRRASIAFCDGVDHAETRPFRTEVKNASPSVLGPVSSSIACSGWGIRPTTLPLSLQMPAMSR